MDVRLATMRELESVYEVETAAFAGRLQWTRDDLLSEIEQKRLYVAVVPGLTKVVGYVAFKVRDGVGTLNSVAVHPHWQHRGIGRALVLHAQADMHGAECVELDCDASLALWYAKFSFDICGSYTSGMPPKQVSRVVMRWVP